jgi:uncharacterized protein YjiS (DUF1127 family)
MPGNIGMVAGLVHRLIDLFINENELPEIRKRRELKRLHKEALHALGRGDLVGYRRVCDELERVSNAA